MYLVHVWGVARLSCGWCCLAVWFGDFGWCTVGLGLVDLIWCGGCLDVGLWVVCCFVGGFFGFVFVDCLHCCLSVWCYYVNSVGMLVLLV